jgi:hypothetical protein
MTPHEKLDQIIALVETGKTRKELADILQVNIAYFSGVCSLLGIKAKRFGAKRANAIRNDIASGMSRREAAEKHGITQTAVCNIMNNKTHVLQVKNDK